MKFVVVADRVVDTLEFTRLYLVSVFDDEIVMIFQSFIEKKMREDIYLTTAFSEQSSVSEYVSQATFMCDEVIPKASLI